jgi:hypothetical protein
MDANKKGRGKQMKGKTECELVSFWEVYFFEIDSLSVRLLFFLPSLLASISAH